MRLGLLLLSAVGIILGVIGFCLAVANHSDVWGILSLVGVLWNSFNFGWIIGEDL